MALLDNPQITRGDRQRLPSWDEDDWYELTDEDGDPYDLTDRTVDLALVISRTNERIDLSNAAEIHEDPTTGQVAITLEESDTSVPVQGRNETLVGEFRLEGGEQDPTTAGSFKLLVYPSRHDIEVGATLLPYRDSFGAWAENGVMDAEGARLSNIGDPENPQDAVNQRSLDTSVGGVDSWEHQFSEDVDAQGNDIANPGAYGSANSPAPAVHTDRISTSTAATLEEDTAELDTVYLDGGTHEVTDRINIDSDVKIDGQGATIKIADGANFWGGVFTLDRESNIVIENLTIDMNQDGTDIPTSHTYNLGVYVSLDASAENITLRDVTIENGHYRGVAFYNAEHVTLENVTIRNCNEGCFEADHGCKDLTTTNCRFRDSSGFGVRVDASAEGVESIAIRDNYIENLGAAIQLRGGAHQSCTIEGNRVARCESGIRAEEHAVVRGNSLHRITGAGIDARNGTSVIDNNLSAVFDDAIRTAGDGMLVEGNIVSGGDGRIEINGSDGIITGNVSRAVNQWGIQTWGEDNKVTHNRVEEGNGSAALSSAVSAGDVVIELDDNPYVLGEQVDIGGETKYLVEWLEDDINGDAIRVELDSELSSAHDSGTSVSSSADALGIHLPSDGNSAQGNITHEVNSSGDYVSVNAVGYETADAEEPSFSRWRRGDIVSFTDSGDDTGSGMYIRTAGSWTQIS